MVINESDNRTNGIVSMMVRWVAGVTGSVVAAADFFTFGVVFLIVPVFLIVGALVAGWLPRVGLWLIWIGAVFVSLWVLPYGIAILLSSVPIDHSGVIVLLTTVAAVLLVILCDAVLVIEAIKKRRGRRSKKETA